MGESVQTENQRGKHHNTTETEPKRPYFCLSIYLLRLLFEETSKQPTTYNKGESMSTMQQIKASRESFRKGQQLYIQGDYNDSLEEFRRTVQLQEVVFGKYHKETIRSYLEQGKAALKLASQENNVLLTLTALKSFQRATRMANVSFQKALNREMWKEIETNWYDVHPETDVSLGILSEIYALEDLGDKAIKRHQYVKAIEHYCGALSLQDALVGKDSLDGADIRYKLGSALFKTSAMPQAQETLQLAYKCYVDQVGMDHPATMGCISKIQTIPVS
jgi:tetratricopeptide (TPR) repeat protein